MFEVGAKVFYPMHGAGIISDIQEKEILGEKQNYLILKMPGEVTLMVPENKISELGLRSVVSEKEIDEVMDIIFNTEKNNVENWNERYNENKEKMKTGNVYELAEVYRDLNFRNNEKNLSTSEKKMLNNVTQVLTSEISAVTGQTLEEINQRLETFGQ